MFKKGQLVKYYGTFNDLLEEVKAKVVWIREDGAIKIETYASHDSPNGWQGWAHPKQLRPLKGK